MLVRVIIAGFVVVIGAFFVTLAMDLKEQHSLQQENIELRLKNARLEEQVKLLDYKQAELTKKIAEMNGKKMDEKIKELAKRIFNLEKDTFVHYELLKEFHYELFKIKMNLTILNWLVISYILYQVINYIWGK